MKERIYLIVKNPFQESDRTRFNTDLLEEHFDLAILDCSEWLLPESLKTRSSVKFELANLHHIRSAAELKAAIIGSGGYALDFVGLFSLKAIRLFNILKRNGIKIVVVDSGPYPSPGPTKSTQSLSEKIQVIIKNKLFQRFINARILNLYKRFSEDMTPDIALVSGTYWMNNPRFSKARTIIPAHSFDYETFLKINQNARPDVKSYAVYLDENIGFHEDNKEMNLTSPVSGIKFLEKLELFFQQTEKQTGLEIKIAAYPSTDINVYKQIFKHRDIIFYQTASLIKQSELVFAHASTALSFSILWRKPIIFIVDSELKSSWYYADIESASKLVKGKQVNIDDKEEIASELDSWKDIDLIAYQDYQDSFIKSRDSSGDFLWSILARGIYK